MNGLLLTVIWAVLALGGWLVVASLAALLVGKSIAIADERELGPQSDTEAERSAA